jgi:hypothetical protein
VVEYEDTRRVADRGEPVGDNECGAVPHDLVKRRQHAGFRWQHRARWLLHRESE